MLERKDCLERVWDKPSFVKEVFTEFSPPGYRYGGYITAFFDERLGRYVGGLAVPTLVPLTGMQKDINWATGATSTSQREMGDRFLNLLALLATPTGWYVLGELLAELHVCEAARIAHSAFSPSACGA